MWTKYPNSRTIFCCGIILPLLLIAGCGDSTTETKGTVSVDGNPVPNGKIVFFPSDGGRSGSGKIKSDGTYEISYVKVGDGLPPGEYKVTIVSDLSKEDPRAFAGENGEQVDDDGFLPEGMVNPSASRRVRKRRLHIVPPKYNNHDSTPLSVTITDTAEPIDFELSSKE